MYMLRRSDDQPPKTFFIINMEEDMSRSDRSSCANRYWASSGDNVAATELSLGPKFVIASPPVVAAPEDGAFPVLPFSAGTRRIGRGRHVVVAASVRIVSYPKLRRTAWPAISRRRGTGQRNQQIACQMVKRRSGGAGGSPGDRQFSRASRHITSADAASDGVET